MSGAIIRLDTSGTAAVADANGRFRLDNVPPGRHQLRVEHPILDTLGVALVSPVAEYVAGDTRAAELATPGVEALTKILCAPAWLARGPAVLVGRVREADSGRPAAGAKVSLVWYEVEIASGVRRVPRVREATVAPNGTYRICGLPAQLEGKVQVLQGPLTSGEVAIAFGEDVLAMRSMSIAAANAVVAAGKDSATGGQMLLGTAKLTGRVLNKAGQPLVAARVQLEGTNRAASTRPDGGFVLDSLPPGTQSLSVRKLGFAPIDQAVDLVSNEPRAVTVTLADYVPVLKEIRVTAERDRELDAVGFRRRKRISQGFFMEGDAINHASQNFSDVLRNVPGIRVMPAGGRAMLTNSRDPNGCVAIVVDGTSWQQLEPGDIDDFLKPYEVAAIEVYSPTNVPLEYQSAGRGCMTVIAWTFRRLERSKK